jgi:hypothetical protein
MPEPTGLHTHENTDVEAIFDGYPPAVRPAMEALRGLILGVAAGLPEVGPLEESLKWGEPAFRPRRRRTGTTLRIDWKARAPGQLSLYVPCTTPLIGIFTGLHPEVFRAEGKRGLHLDRAQPLPRAALEQCVALALTYHRRDQSPVWADLELDPATAARPG